MGLRRMLVKMLDPAGNADGTKFVGIDGGKAAWVDPPSGGITGLTSADSSVTITDNGDGTLDLAASGTGGGGGGGGAGADRRWTVGPGETSIDEFNDDTLDAAWTRVDGANAPAANVTWTEGADVLSVMQVNTVDIGDGFHAMAIPLSVCGGPLATGDAFITCATLFGQPGTSYSVIGLGVADGNTYGAGKQAVAETYFGASPQYAQTVALNGYTNFTTKITGQVDNSAPPGALQYIRLANLGSDVWRSDRSPDGISWRKGGTITISSFVPTHALLTTRKPTAGGVHIGSFEFLRRVTGIT